MKKVTRKILIILGTAIAIVLLVAILFSLYNVNFLETDLYRSIAKSFSFIFWFNIILIALFIFFENRNPSRTWAWLLVLFAVPWLGFILYILLGRNTFKRRRVKQKQKSDKERMNYFVQYQSDIFSEVDIFPSDKLLNNKLINLLLKNSEALFTVNNSVKVLTNGKEKFPEMIKDLENAKHHIHLEYFIIKNDNIGNKIKDILIKKAQEGLEVRLMYDSVGCWHLGKKYVRDLEDAGVETYAFFPVLLPILSEELNYRNHRKILVIDGSIGYVGGLNIGDEYLGKKRLGFWRDTHLKIQGEAVQGLQRIFLNDWAFVSKENISETKQYLPINKEYGSSMIQITSSGPDSDWFAIHQAYFTMINCAKKSIWITTPYFVPDDGIMMGLKTAALSGIDVRIIIPNKPDHFFVYWATQDNIEELLEAGVKVYQYHNGFVHSKLIIVDGNCASVGTANFDVRSFQINFEVNAFLYDVEVIKILEKDFNKDINHSQEIELETFRTRKWYRKFLEATARLVSPLQ
ncbi:cardiolipin synthase [Clostridium sp. 'deep sea']|uniref:cardiolipin synthase n=1 Tax=Clostridium sp. 'deep sea' TaxID=2779445 RepID=UPI0018966834|nr:cardiolipin synthase [Clostridium sp. 'deep sea']QOR35518.1 cardiolipin synthase [Clostridium sp. 'deep sea']